MDTLIYLFIAVTLVAALLASLAIGAPRTTRVRVIALLLVALFIPLAYVQYVELLSKPKPKRFEWFERNVSEAEILGVSLREGEAIYMWLLLEGTVEPRYYVFPWNLKLAERLEQDIGNAIVGSGRLVIKEPFRGRGGPEVGDLNVKIVPPPKLPSKPPRIPARIFNPREVEI